MHAAGCSRQGAAPAPPVPVVVISIDTLRPDHLGMYGYPKATSPNLDRFAAEAVVFEQAISTAPSTLPAHASLFTSLVPDRHGASFARKVALPAQVPTLASELSAAGWVTQGIHNGGQLDEVFGIGAGFEVWREVQVPVFRRVVDRAVEWLDRRDHAEPFLLFLHTYEVHHPYQPKRWRLDLFDDADYDGPLPHRIAIPLLERINSGELEIDERDLGRIVAAYDAGIHSMDEAFGRLMSALRERELYHRALIVVTSDHGEEFNEHGVVGWHAHSLYDELLRVPLLIKFPGSRWAGTRLRRQVGLIDVAPTVLDVAGIDRPPTFEGSSLRAVLNDRSRTHRRWVVASRDDPGDQPLRAVRQQSWKLIGDRLFHLPTDPAERVDRADEHSTTAQRLRLLLVDLDPVDATRKTPSLDETLSDRLRALGYLR